MLLKSSHTLTISMRQLVLDICFQTSVVGTSVVGASVVGTSVVGASVVVASGRSQTQLDVEVFHSEVHG